MRARGYDAVLRERGEGRVEGFVKPRTVERQWAREIRRAAASPHFDAKRVMRLAAHTVKREIVPATNQRADMKELFRAASGFQAAAF